MACCTQYCAAEEEFDNKVAERDLQRYRRRGPDPITRLMLAELRRWPLQGGQLLDVGGGIGVICSELADTGVAATLVEASRAYLEVARRELGSRYSSRAQFFLGDFVKIAGTLPDAVVVTSTALFVVTPMLRRSSGRQRGGPAGCSRSPIPAIAGICVP